MNMNESIDFILRSQDEIVLRKSEDYVRAHYNLGNFSQMTLDVGPYCNLRCVGCYAECGPEYPAKVMTEVGVAAMDGAIENRIDSIRFTDGEPLVPRHTNLVKEACSRSDQLKTIIVTNGKFAYGKPGLIYWMELLADNGWNFDSMPSHTLDGKMVNSQFKISQGGDYPKKTSKVLPEILHALYHWFDLDDVKDKVGIYYTRGKKELSKGVKPYHFRMLYNLARIEFLGDTEIDGCLYYKTKLGAVKFEPGKLQESGRGRQALLSMGYKDKPLQPNDLDQVPHPQKHLHIDHKGNVGHGYAAPCVHESRQFGNILEEPLDNIIQRIVNDSLFWVHKLGSVAFTYTIAQQHFADYNLLAIDKCGICKQLFEDKELIRHIRSRFSGDFDSFKDALAEEYLRYANQQYG